MRKKIIPILTILLGLCLLVYPWISNYLFEKDSGIKVGSYEKNEKQIAEDVREKMFQAARNYNAKLAGSHVVLTDPFHAKEEGLRQSDYYNLLKIDTTGMMCYLEIPCIKVNLPVFHGTLPQTLERGLGHLEGTSLPVGGKSTHCVITGHTGLNKAKLFTDLTEMKKGDQFYIHVLGKTLAYEVDEIQVVLPENTDPLQIIDGKDYITLITCTPYGENTHRLLVRGKRTKYIPSKYQAEKKKHRDSLWMKSYKKALLIGLLIATVLITLIILAKKRKKR